MSFKTVNLNKNAHSKLQELSDKRKEEGHPVSAMAAILHELVLKQHKKEVK